MRAWMRVMFGVITVVKAQEVVQPTVVARDAARVFVMALQVAQEKAHDESGQIHQCEESRTPPRADS